MDDFRLMIDNFLMIDCGFLHDLYTLWENGHDDSFDFNVLWQKAVSIFIYCNTI